MGHDCTVCTNEGNPYMQSNSKDCTTWSYGLENNCNKNTAWQAAKYCQYSCWVSGNGYVGDNCSTTTTTSQAATEAPSVDPPTSLPTPLPTPAPTHSPTPVPTNAPPSATVCKSSRSWVSDATCAGCATSYSWWPCIHCECTAGTGSLVQIAKGREPRRRVSKKQLFLAPDHAMLQMTCMKHLDL